MSAPRIVRLLAGLALLATSGCAVAPTRSDMRRVLPPMPAPGEPCPQWTLYPADHHSADGSAMLGCVTHANLRSMLVNPGELDQAHPMTPADGGRMIRAIDDYREGRRPGAQGGPGPAVPTLVMPGAGGGSTP